jgi:hypothetical protein
MSSETEPVEMSETGCDSLFGAVEAHHRALAVLLLDAEQRELQRLLAVLVHGPVLRETLDGGFVRRAPPRRKSMYAPALNT